jgi:serine/threonine protein kinase
MMLLGRYQLLHALDPTGTVWRARDEVLHRDVTVRQVEAAAVPAVQAATVLRHPAIVTIHDVVTQDDQVWVVTELTEGHTLATAGIPAESQAIAIGLDLLEALASAHALGLLHGGIQPDRVILTSDGHVKLAGFGAAPPHEAFTPPEPETVPASDLWGLAATLFTVAEGRVPFASAPDKMHGQMGPAIRASRLGAVLRPLLHPDPVARPDIDAVRTELRKLAPGKRKRKVWEFRPVVLAIGAVVVAAVVAPAAAFAVLPDTPDTPARPAVGPVVPARSTAFDSIPDGCGLLTDEQAAKAVADHEELRGVSEGSCRWTTKTEGGDFPRTLNFELSIRVEFETDKSSPYDDSKYVAELNGPVIEVDGLGNEAFIRETLRGFDLTFRLANAVVDLEYTHGGKPNPKMEAVIEQTARSIGEALNRG